MCTLALYFRVVNEFPLLAAANRDEHYDRAAISPRLLDLTPKTVAGTDVRAGGTWLGANEHGLMAAILNRHAGADQPCPPGSRSRGLLCLDVLGCASAAAARDLVRSRREFYQPFTLVVADLHEAWFALNAGPASAITGLAPGLHVFNNAAAHDELSEKKQRAFRLFAEAHPNPEEIAAADSWLLPLRRALSDHSLGSSAPDAREAICVHGEVSGTVSSSIVGISTSTRQIFTYYSDGPPCRNEFQKVPSLDVRS